MSRGMLACEADGWTKRGAVRYYDLRAERISFFIPEGSVFAISLAHWASVAASSRCSSDPDNATESRAQVSAVP